MRHDIKTRKETKTLHGNSWENMQFNQPVKKGTTYAQTNQMGQCSEIFCASFVVYYHFIIGLYGNDYFVPTYGIEYTIIIYAFNMPLLFFTSRLFATTMLSRKISDVIKSRFMGLFYRLFSRGIVQRSVITLLSRCTNGKQSWKSVYFTSMSSLCLTLGIFMITFL